MHTALLQDVRLYNPGIDGQFLVFLHGMAWRGVVWHGMAMGLGHGGVRLWWLVGGGWWMGIAVAELMMGLKRAAWFGLAACGEGGSRSALLLSLFFVVADVVVVNGCFNILFS